MLIICPQSLGQRAYYYCISAFCFLVKAFEHQEREKAMLLDSGNFTSAKLPGPFAYVVAIQSCQLLPCRPSLARKL